MMEVGTKGNGSPGQETINCLGEENDQSDPSQGEYLGWVLGINRVVHGGEGGRYTDQGASTAKGLWPGNSWPLLKCSMAGCGRSSGEKAVESGDNVGCGLKAPHKGPAGGFWAVCYSGKDSWQCE